MTPAGPVGGNALDLALFGAPDAPGLLSAADGPRACERLGVLPFDQERQLATVLARRREDHPVLVTKGAPQAVLERCVGVGAESRRVPAGPFEDGARAHQQPSLTATKLRLLEITAGAPALKGKPTGVLGHRRADARRSGRSVGRRWRLRGFGPQRGPRQRGGWRSSCTSAVKAL